MMSGPVIMPFRTPATIQGGDSVGETTLQFDLHAAWRGQHEGVCAQGGKCNACFCWTAGRIRWHSTCSPTVYAAACAAFPTALCAGVSVLLAAAVNPVL